MVLAKEKNEEDAMRWLIRSVNLYPMNWGCWLEMTSLIGRVEDVSLSFMNSMFMLTFYSSTVYHHIFLSTYYHTSSTCIHHSSYINQRLRCTRNYNNYCLFSQRRRSF